MINTWKQAVICPAATITEALEIIDSESLRVALVTDTMGDLKGVVTDGDIRRALLRGEGLDAKVDSIMNTSPITANYGTVREELLQKMHQHDILFIPLLEGKRLVGLETLHSASVDKTVYQNPVFIMAGGFGTRLKPLTDSCPKPMLKVGGRPMLETLILSFRKEGFVNFYISTHYMAEKISDYFGDGSNLGVKISYVHESTPLGTGGALGLLPIDKSNKLPLIMVNGDVLTKVNFRKLLDFHLENDADATMCVREYDYQIPYGVISGEAGRVTRISEKPIQRYFVNAGIYVLSPLVINSVEKNREVDMPDLLECHMKTRDKVMMFPIHEYWLDIGRMEDFKRAQSDIYAIGLF